MVGLLVLIMVCGCQQREEVVGEMKKAISPVPLSNELTAVPSDMNDEQSSESETKLIKSTSENQLDVRLFFDDTKVVGITVGKKELTDAELNKNFCLLTLADEPDIRARSLIKYLRHVLTEQQKQDALNYLLQRDYKFEKLKQRRNEVLENAIDGQDIDPLLREIEVETVNLSQKLRLEIYSKLLTQEQKQFLEDERNKKKAEEKAELEGK
jgi:hypothetical protein